MIGWLWYLCDAHREPMVRTSVFWSFDWLTESEEEGKPKPRFDLVRPMDISVMLTEKPVGKRSVFWSIDWLTGREERSTTRERVKRGFVWRKSAFVPEQEEILLPGRVDLNEYQICRRLEKLLIAVFAIRLRKKSQFWVWFWSKSAVFFCFSRIVEKKARRLWIEEGQCKIQECEAFDRGLFSKSHTAAAAATALLRRWKRFLWLLLLERSGTPV